MLYRRRLSTLLSAPRSQPGIDLGSTQDRSDKKHHRKNIFEKNIFEKTSSEKHHRKKNIIGRNTFRCFLLELRKAMEEER